MRFVVAFGFGDGRVEDRAALVVEQHRGGRFAHVHVDIVREHADQEVGADPRRWRMGRIWRSDALIARNALSTRPNLVGQHDVGGGHPLFRHVGPDHVEPVQGRLVGDVLLLAPSGEGFRSDPQIEVLSHLALVESVNRHLKVTRIGVQKVLGKEWFSKAVNRLLPSAAPLLKTGGANRLSPNSTRESRGRPSFGK